MLRHAGIALAALLGLVALAPRPGAADTPLKSLTLRHDLLGFEAVGRLDLGDGFCTGALIAPDLVLTAAHCLIGPSGARRDPRAATFRAGYRDGGGLAERAGARAIVHPDYRTDETDGLRQLRADIALLQLAAPIPAGRIAPFALAPAPAAGADVSVVSYARDRARAPAWQRRCGVLAAGQGALMMTCDTDFGASGAPVFDTGAGRPRIVSLISRGARSEDGQTLVWGMDAARAVPALKAALRAGRGVWPEAEAAAARRVTVGGETAAPVPAPETGPGGARFVRP